MRTWPFVSLLVAVGGLTAPASAMYPSPITLWFAGDPAAVAAKLAGVCAALRAEVTVQQDRRLTCELPANAVDKLAVQMSGEGYSSSPVMILSFHLTEDRGAVRVNTMHGVAVQTRTPAYVQSGPLYSYRHTKVRRAMTELLEAMGGEQTRPAKLRS